MLDGVKYTYVRLALSIYLPEIRIDGLHFAERESCRRHAAVQMPMRVRCLSGSEETNTAAWGYPATDINVVEMRLARTSNVLSVQ